jgi:hypothetical protein
VVIFIVSVLQAIPVLRPTPVPPLFKAFCSVMTDKVPGSHFETKLENRNVAKDDLTAIM